MDLLETSMNGYPNSDALAIPSSVETSLCSLSSDFIPTRKIVRARTSGQLGSWVGVVPGALVEPGQVLGLIQMVYEF